MFVHLFVSPVILALVNEKISKQINVDGFGIGDNKSRSYCFVSDGKRYGEIRFIYNTWICEVYGTVPNFDK